MSPFFVPFTPIFFSPHPFTSCSRKREEWKNPNSQAFLPSVPISRKIREPLLLDQQECASSPFFPFLFPTSLVRLNEGKGRVGRRRARSNMCHQTTPFLRLFPLHTAPLATPSSFVHRTLTSACCNVPPFPLFPRLNNKT